MLKEGYDHFEVTRQEPKVDVCDKRYVFDAEPTEPGAKFDPRGHCPAYEVPSEIASAVAAKKKKDETAVASLISRGTPAAPVKMGTDGGMHQVFAEALQGGRAVRGKDGEIELVRVSAPGTIPAHVNPPSNVVIGGAVAAAAAPATPAPVATQPASPPRSTSVAASAPAQPAAKPAQSAPAAPPTQTASLNPAERARNFFSNLFTRSPAPAAAAPAPSPATAAKPAAPRGSTPPATTPPTQTASAPPAKPKPTTVAEAKPKPSPEPEESTASWLANGASRQPSSVSAFNGSPANNSPGLLTGAAPVIPSGSFGTSWPSTR